MKNQDVARVKGCDTLDLANISRPAGQQLGQLGLRPVMRWAGKQTLLA